MRPNSPSALWDRVQVGAPNDCWPWTGTVRPNGYGSFSLNGRTVSTHRLAYRLATGVDPGRLVVRHRCDNPRCCNPAHLELGTFAQNTRDMHERGRWCDRKGSNHPLAKLSEQQVLEIRRRRMAGERGVYLAAVFVVSPPTITRLAKNKGWTHVQDEARAA